MMIRTPKRIGRATSTAAAPMIVSCLFRGSSPGAGAAPFSVFRRYREDDPESKNSRVDQLMRSLGLDKDGEDIPWGQVSARIGQLRQTGLAWLADALSKP